MGGCSKFWSKLEQRILPLGSWCIFRWSSVGDLKVLKQMKIIVHIIHMQAKKNTHLSMLSEFSLNIVQYMQWKQCRDCYQFLNFIKICPLYHDKRQSFTPFDLLFFPWLFNWCYFRSSDHFLQSFTGPLNIKAAEAPSSINSPVHNDSKTSTGSRPHGGPLLTGARS